jgi:hypothetical protein
MEMSNKSLALMLVAAIVISLGGTIISLNRLNEMGLTGQATATGNVSVVIQSNASCNVDTNVSFGTGRPTLNYTLSTNQNNNQYGWGCDGTSWGTACYGITVNNTGNVILNISYNSTYNGTGLLGAPQNENDFQYRSSNKYEAGSCQYPYNASWANVNTTQGNNQTNVCMYLNYTSTNTVIMDFNVTVTPSTTPGTKSTLIYIGCTQ